MTDWPPMKCSSVRMRGFPEIDPILVIATLDAVSYTHLDVYKRQIHPELRALLERELPNLEQRIWAASERDTVEGIACNTGVGDCESGKKGKMVATNPTRDDLQRSAQILRTAVLKNWVQRCGEKCATVWNETLRRVTRLDAPSTN